MVYRDQAPQGKLDLVVDMNFRMDTSALYSDIVLPAATWYEKDDLNTTDLHSFINPMQAAVAPAWESKSDWDIYKAIAQRRQHAGAKFICLIQSRMWSCCRCSTIHRMRWLNQTCVDWKTGEVDAIPGKTMPKFRVVTRDYTRLYEQMVSLGPEIENKGVSAHGLTYPGR